MKQGGAEARRPYWQTTRSVIGACIDVHRALGPGLLESAYEMCVVRELELRGLRYARQVSVPLHYKGVALECGYRLDLVVEGHVIVELKAVGELQPVHSAQVLTYLAITGLDAALLINFNVEVLRLGIRRFVLTKKNSAPPRLPVSSDR